MSDHYTAAGVDIDAANRAKALMTEAVRSTHSTAVLAGMGAFGGCFDAASALRGLHRPVLVASTDGVGTKTLIAATMGQYESVGHDLVNHCVNDILVQGARPIFFLDYIASAKLNPVQVAAVVSGVAAACRAVGCALLGGETAEMPQVYQDGAFDLAGTIVGVVDRDEMLPKHTITPGDAIVAFPSTGLHTNGYSLARRIVEQAFADTAGSPYLAAPPELAGQRVGDALLAIHRCYYNEVEILHTAAPLKALAHITGGGLLENLPRVMPHGLGAHVHRGTWRIPPIFEILCRAGNVSEMEALRVFNMGLGMIAIIEGDSLQAARTALPELQHIGTVVEGAGVALVG